MSRSVVLGAVVILSLFGLAGCDEAPTSPTTPDVPVVTESFAGTVTVNGAVTHSFVVSTPSSVTATLVTVSPAADVPMGMYLGIWNATTQSCQVVIASDNAVQGRVLLGSAQSSGTFCVRVYDVGSLTAPNSYELQVSHQ